MAHDVLHPMMNADTVFTMPLADGRNRSPRPGRAAPPFRWLTRVGALAVPLFLGTVVFVPPEYRMTALLAVTNLAIAGGFSWLCLQRNATLGMLAAAFLTPLVVQTSFSTLYFCIFNPSFGVVITHEFVPVLANNMRLQMAALLFLLSFIPGWLIVAPRARRSMPQDYESLRAAATRICKPAFATFTTIVVVLIVLRIANVGYESGPGYIAYGLFRFCLGLPLLCGAAWKSLGWSARVSVTLVLLANAAFSILTNNRSYGFIPCVFFGLGFLLLSDLSVPRKARFLVLLVCLFAFLMIAGDAGRKVGLGIWYSGLDELAHRVEVLSQKAETIASTRHRWADEIFARLFTMGGYQTTSLMPEMVAFKPFYPSQYVLEVVSQGFLPRNLATRLVPPVYEEKSSLIAFGFRLVAGRHSVDRHCVGAAWEMGGSIAVMLIGLLTGFLIGLWSRILAECTAAAPELGAVCFAIGVDRTFHSVSEGVPSMLHDLVYVFPVGLCLYAIAWLVTQVTPGIRSPMRMREIPSGPMHAAGRTT